VYVEGETQVAVTSNGLNSLCQNLGVDMYGMYILVSAHREDFIDPIVRAHSATKN
jgi:hypothetical protein